MIIDHSKIIASMIFEVPSTQSSYDSIAFEIVSNPTILSFHDL